MTLTPTQRSDRLRVRTDALAGWRDRAQADLDGWPCEGAPLALGDPWPRRGGVVRLAHPEVSVPDGWPLAETLLDLDLGGEALPTLHYPDGHERFGLDPYHQRFPLRGPRLAVEAEAVARRPTHTNTPWDAARFEVAGHRFAVLYEPGYGVALLNDGRYGHHALPSELGLSLLRSPAHPDAHADEGEHAFTDALLPHPGDWWTGGVLAEAEDLAQPLRARVLTGPATEGTWQPLAFEDGDVAGPER